MEFWIEVFNEDRFVVKSTFGLFVVCDTQDQAKSFIEEHKDNPRYREIAIRKAGLEYPVLGCKYPEGWGA